MLELDLQLEPSQQYLRGLVEKICQDAGFDNLTVWSLWGPLARRLIGDVLNWTEARLCKEEDLTRAGAVTAITVELEDLMQRSNNGGFPSLKEVLGVDSYRQAPGAILQAVRGF